MGQQCNIWQNLHTLHVKAYHVFVNSVHLGKSKGSCERFTLV